MSKFSSNLNTLFDLEAFELKNDDAYPIAQFKQKTCPKCGVIHRKRGPYCSRSCGNVRQYTVEQKAQKSKASKNPKIHISQKELRELYSYDIINGGLLHKTEIAIDASNNHLKQKHMNRIGKPAARITTAGYKSIDINCISYREHRLVYYWHTGEYPRMLDHINGNKADNRIENLRPCEYWQNKSNTNLNARHRTKKTLPIGVNKIGSEYTAKIKVNGIVHELGKFSTPEDAYNAYCEKHYELRGEFAIKLPPYSAYDSV